MVSTTASPDVAARFVQLHADPRDDLGLFQPTSRVPTPKGLRYPFQGASQPQGPLFVATVMEEKWDLYLRARYLYFARSWTGEPHYAAEVSWAGNQWEIVQVSRADEVREDAKRSISVVDYLIKSHLYDLAAPHPLQPAFKGDDGKLALASFSEFGRRALYGTFEDLTHEVSIENALWGRPT